MSARRIIITGATGGLGLALVREAAARGHEVRGVGRDLIAGEQVKAAGAQFTALNLAAPDADLGNILAGCDSIIHAAALSASWGPRSAFEAANIGMTQRLLHAASLHRVSRFVFVSSPSIFATFEDRLNIGEDAAPNPHPLNHYAATKLAAERLVLAANSETLACCAIRPRALVGEGDHVILPKLAQLASRARMPLPGGGEALIELTDLRDAARAIYEAEERAPDLQGRAINISGGRAHKVRDVAQQLAGALGTAPRLVSIPLFAAHGLAAMLESAARLLQSQKEPVLTRYTLATLAYSQTFDLEPARQLLGFTPQHDALATLLDQARQIAAQESAP